jgi:integrase
MARKAKQPDKHPRRKPHTGTIRQKPGREKPWEAEYKHADGTRYESFQSYEDAAQWLDGLVADEKDGRNIGGGFQLVQDYLPMWLELHKPHVAAKTFAGYVYYCELACGQGGLGRKRMDAVDTVTAQRMINQFAADDFKNTAQIKSVLFQAFEYAFDPLGYIKKNPFAKVRVPEIEHRTAIAITKTQRAHLLAMADLDDAKPLQYRKDAPPPMALLWHLYSRLAFRRGEGLMLKWSNIDFKQATITIAGTRGRLGATHIEGRTKGKRNRTVPAPQDVLDRLRALKAAQMRAALANGWQWRTTGYVFVYPETGEPLSVDAVSVRWKRLRKAAGLPAAMTIHDQRHTALTVLELDGTPSSILMALAGHRTPQMTEHYTDHASLDDVRRALG